MSAALRPPSGPSLLSTPEKASTSRSKPPKCLVRGSISPPRAASGLPQADPADIDEFFHLPHIVQPGETISSTRYTKRAGGKGANQACAVAKAGVSVDMDGCIGEDGGWVRDLLGRDGVGTSRLNTLKNEVRTIAMRAQG